MTYSIKSNLDKVKSRILTACENSNRDITEVQLLAVSKTKPVAMVQDALVHGQYHFGENYLQDALEKITCITDQNVVWHFIGAIQSNKTRAIAEHFDWVHTVASDKVARRLSNQRPDNRPPLNILLQVNIDNENTKAGLPPDAIDAVIESSQSLENVKLRGLMAIPAKTDNPEVQRLAFKRLRLLKDSINERFDLPDFDQLSMGMSADLEVAVAEGATILRIGTSIFGERSR